MIENKKMKSYALHNFRTIPQMELLSEEEKFTIEVVGNVLPFKVNNYVIDELINWNDYNNDPIYHLTFPQRGMLSDDHFNQVAAWVQEGISKPEMRKRVHSIRMELNPHPAGQADQNVPEVNGQRLPGVQHKYRETILFFPSQGQTCHSYCTFCFRWPQFVGMDELKFAMKETELVVEYLKQHPEVTDIIFTGGDPMIMSPKIFGGYIDALLEADLPNLQNIRIGSKSLSYWPYKFVNDKGADEMLDIFRKVNESGKHLSFMGHFCHPVEMQTEVVQEAIKRILDTGTQIRTQSPVMKNINDDADAWAEMWRKQVELGCTPYYMFLARDTGAQDYFAVPLERAWSIFRNAYNQVSGIARTVRGPSMSAGPGKVQVLGVTHVNGEKVLSLRFLQGRNPDWVGRPFFAEYDEDAIWLDDLKPAFGEDSFFFEESSVEEETF